MQERIKGYLRNWDREISLGNLDFDTSLYLKRMKEKGHKFEFGKYDWKDRSVEIIVELPDPPKVPAPGSQEEWEERREWYLKHSGTSIRTLIEGMTEGYLNDHSDDWMIMGAIADQITDYEYELGNFSTHKDLLWQLEYDEEYGEANKKKPKRCVKFDARKFLKEGIILNMRLIEKARKFRRKLTEGKLWTDEQFRTIGFRIPNGLKPAEKDSYVLDTLGEFFKILEERKFRLPKVMLGELIQELGLDKALFKEAKENPWEVYEDLKQAYCANAQDPEEYDCRIDDIIFALGV